MKMTCCATYCATCCAACCTARASCAAYSPTCYATCCATCCATCYATCFATCCPTCYFDKQLLFKSYCLITIGYIQAKTVNCLSLFCYVQSLCSSPIFLGSFAGSCVGNSFLLCPLLNSCDTIPRNPKQDCDIFARCQNLGRTRHMSMFKGHVCFFCQIV